MTEEIWKNITEYPNYSVSNLGNVRNNNKIRYEKRFKTLEEAIIDRNIKLKELHGDFASYD